MIKNNHRWLWLILVAVLAFFIQLTGGRFYGKDKRPVYQEILLKPAAGCDIAKQPCTARSDQVAVTLAFAEQPSGLKVFPVQVSARGLKHPETARLTLVFTMSGMDMGQVKQVLKWNQQKQQWQGQSILPICSTGRRDWNVRLELISKEVIYLADFSFVVK